MKDYSCSHDWSGRPELGMRSRALKVMIQPGLGRHKVYGIFLIPQGCHPVSVKILGMERLGKVCEDSKKVHPHELMRLSIPDGFYPVKIYIRTRYVVVITLLGMRTKLRQRQNWVVSYAED